MSLDLADNIIGRVGKLVTPADCKSVATSTAGSSPAAPTKYGTVTQMVEWQIEVLQVRCSIHLGPTNFKIVMGC